MRATDRVKQILSWYGSDSPGVKANLARLMNHGTLAGTGKLVILPVDQGFEHGALRSFEPNPDAYDPEYHIQLAIDSGCNAYAAPLGFIESVADKYAGAIPLILKVNNSDTLAKVDPCSAVTSSVKDAQRLGCTAIGFTIYPGSSLRNQQYESLREIILEAREAGMPSVVWAYPRGAGLSKEGETGVDIAAYAAQISAQLGAHIIKIKPPTAHVEQAEAKKVIEKYNVPIKTLADRVRHCVRSAFNGKRIVIFSGGENRDAAGLLDDVKQLAEGGAFGSIMGRNAFQRPHAEGLKLLQDVIQVFKNAP